MQKPIRTLVSAAVVALMASAANAGSFSLYTEGNGSAVGNFAAGIAAEAADASTGWYNPAGLALIREQQIVAGGVGVFPSSKITGYSTFRTLGLPDYVQTFNGLDGAKNGLVPSFHYALPLGENATFGLSVVAPFGLVTKWGNGSPVRYSATLSDLMTTTVSPEIGGKLNDNLAVGAGIDFQYTRVKFNRMLGAPALMQAFGLSPFAVDSESYNKGDSFGIGFHAGVLTMFNDNHTRIGLNYQSQMRQKFHGYSRLTGPLATPGLNVLNPLSVMAANPYAVARTDTLSSNNIDFPDIVTLSGYQDVNESLALLGSVVYTGWHTVSTIELNNAVAYAPPSAVPPLPGRQILVNTTSRENYSDAWRFAVGANYRFNQELMLRVGGGYDETPTNDRYRGIRVPDANRWALSIGAHYQARPWLGVDVGYTHLFTTEDPRISKPEITGATSDYTVTARAKGRADLVGAQLTWIIDKEMPVPTK
ncbi:MULTISPECIES: OmpP1/FadL family transporter [unclassified Legionella]|uniref:OmpP1/FadL family transporter n=1 Tax=unclassified Legionella TaxID=2622702 RepID=UPI001055B9CF|nr:MULTISPECIES: outer membrane protein transport protein [unclassified Legionella]MDI9819155.1 outer membrane protein transport protein [Legionella sp. PL877]